MVFVPDEEKQPEYEPPPKVGVAGDRSGVAPCWAQRGGPRLGSPSFGPTEGLSGMSSLARCDLAYSSSHASGYAPCCSTPTCQTLMRRRSQGQGRGESRRAPMRSSWRRRQPTAPLTAAATATPAELRRAASAARRKRRWRRRGSEARRARSSSSRAGLSSRWAGASGGMQGCGGRARAQWAALHAAAVRAVQASSTAPRPRALRPADQHQRVRDWPARGCDRGGAGGDLLQMRRHQGGPGGGWMGCECGWVQGRGAGEWAPRPGRCAGHFPVGGSRAGQAGWVGLHGGATVGAAAAPHAFSACPPTTRARSSLPLAEPAPAPAHPALPAGPAADQDLPGQAERAAKGRRPGHLPEGALCGPGHPGKGCSPGSRGRSTCGAASQRGPACNARLAGLPPAVLVAPGYNVSWAWPLYAPALPTP